MEHELDPHDMLTKDSMVIVLTVVVNEKYPCELEAFSLQSTELVKRSINGIKAGLEKHIKEDLLNSNGDPFMMDAVEWIKDAVKEKSSSRTVCMPDCKKMGETYKKCVVLMLDHMRSKQKYTKLITGWMTELKLIGRVIFFKKKIWVVLHGENDSVREYLKRHKTCSVDVDSNGRPCKERMLSVITDVNSTVDLESSHGVKAVECGTWNEVSNELMYFGVNPEEMRK